MVSLSRIQKFFIKVEPFSQCTRISLNTRTNRRFRSQGRPHETGEWTGSLSRIAMISKDILSFHFAWIRWLIDENLSKAALIPSLLLFGSVLVFRMQFFEKARTVPIEQGNRYLIDQNRPPFQMGRVYCWGRKKNRRTSFIVLGHRFRMEHGYVNAWERTRRYVEMVDCLK